MKDAEKLKKESEYSKDRLTKLQNAPLVLTVLAVKKLAERIKKTKCHLPAIKRLKVKISVRFVNTVSIPVAG